jgi:signal transduction histidine kinase
MKSQGLKQIFGGSTRRIKVLVGSFGVICAIFLAVYYISVIGPNTVRAFSGEGVGTLDDPYQIANCNQLQEMNLARTSNYVLVQDVDCNDTINWNNGQGFASIDFAGSLDGRNFSIVGLYINRPTEFAVGLFSNTDNTNFIANLKFINGPSTQNQIAINGGTNVGVVAGELRQSVQLRNVHSELNVQANSSSPNVGGLVGLSRGNIARSSVNSLVTVVQSDAENRTANIGGIVGAMDGFNLTMSMVIDSYASGEVTIGSNDPASFASATCGGIVGYIDQLATIAKDYATNTVACDTPSASYGGLIGYVQNGTGEAGNNPQVANNFSIGEVIGSTGSRGGLIGLNLVAGIDLSSNYFDATSSTVSECSGSASSACTAVNTDGSEADYFFDSNRAVYATWDTTSDWQFTGSLPVLRTAGVRSNPPANINLVRDGNNFNLSWDAPIVEDGRSEGITDYQIYYKAIGQSDIWNYYDDGISASTNAIVSGLPIPGSYTFRIKAMSDSGSGIYSTEYNFATGMPETAPQNIQPTAGSKSFTFTWDAVADATSYQLQYRKTGETSWVTNGIIEYTNQTAVLRGLEEQTSYEFQIRALNIAGSGPWSETITESTTAVISYTISNCQELQAMRDDLDGNYVLANNIDCANLTEDGNPVNFEPVGNGKQFFAGSLNGNNFTISNLTIDVTETNDGTSYIGAGLFGVVAGANLQNITLENASVTGIATLDPTIDTDGNGLPDAPALPIDPVNPTLPTTEEAVATGQEAGQQVFNGSQTLTRWALGSVAGVVGGSGTYSNIKSNNVVVAGAVSGGVFGIVVPLSTFSEANGSLIDLAATASSLTINGISSSGDVSGFISGGLIGIAAARPNLQVVEPGNLTIQNSFSTASVSANIGGGILGFGSSLSALALLGTQNNTAEGVVDNLSTQNIVIKNSYATGPVSACQSPSEIRIGALGGIIGAGSGVRIESSYATGAVSTCSANSLTELTFGNAYGGALGGLSGALLLSSISDSYATGNVSAINTLPSDTDKFPVYIGVAGGLSGILINSGDQNGRYAVSSSYATGNVSAESPTGLVSINAGLVGVYVGSGTIQSSYAKGQVRNTMQSSSQGGSSIAGGLLGVGIGLDVPYTLGLILQDPVTPTYGLVINNSYATGEIRNTKIGPGVNATISGGATGVMLGKVTLANSHALGNVVNDSRDSIEVDTGVDGEAVLETVSKNDNSISIAGGLSGVAIGSDIVPIISPDVVDPETAPAAIRIDSTFAKGSVNGIIAGGLLGSGELSLSINKSYATGNVRGSLAGGIAGQLGSLSGVASAFLAGFISEIGTASVPILGINLATYLDDSRPIDVTNTYATSNVTGLRNVFTLNPNERDPGATFINNVSTYTPSAIGGLVGVYAAPGGLLENSYASGAITMPTVSFPQDRRPNQLKLPEIPSVAGGVIGVNFAIPKPNITKINSPEASGITDLNEFVSKPQTIRNVFSASPLSITGDTLTAGFSGLTLSPIGAVVGNDISDSNILSQSNNYFDRSKITVNDCVGPSGSAYDVVNTAYKTEYIPDANDNNILEPNFPENWASTYIDPVVKRPGCNLVNINNAQPNYFINNKSNAPLTSWNFNGLWFTQQKDYPKFVAGAVSPDNPGVGPNTPLPPKPPVIPPITETTSSFTNPTTVGYVRNIAKKLGRVNSDPQRVKGLKVLIASVPPFIAQSLPYLFILLLLLLAALYSWQALRQYAELAAYRDRLARIIATKESVDNFLAITTHYLNTPSAIMSGAVELLASLKKISKEKADMLSAAIKKNASDSAQLLVDNQVSSAQSTSELKQIRGKQPNPLLRREVWVPALISLSLLILANVMFMYAEVFSRSRIRIGIEILLFGLSLALVVLAYHYRDMLEDTKRLAKERLRIEKELYDKRSSFIPKAATVIGANVTAIRNAGAGLKTIPQSTLFFNGLAKLEEVNAALNNLTTFSNVSDNPPLFDITTYANRVIRETQIKAQEKNITIVSDIDLGVVSRIQPAEIKQLLTSVMSNAVKFSNDTSTVNVSLHRRFNKIVIIVKDQGIGISKEKLPSLLRPFTRGTDSMQYNYEGIGLDLYADKVIVDKLGGKMTITSQLNKGTTVSISIPINRASTKGASAIAVNTVA